MILKTFLRHEILSLLKSKRVYLTVLMFMLLFISVFTVRVIEYQKQINNYIVDLREAGEASKNPLNYSYINIRAIHQPLIFSIYNQGFSFSRVVRINFYRYIDSSQSENEENNQFYYGNDRIDITFLITFFLSLFILLVSYDCVNGEKQSGTLRLLMTFPIKRQSFVLKKILGVFIFITFIFTALYALSLICLVFLYGNLLNSGFFLSAFFYWFLVLLFIFFFCLLGIFISVCTVYPNRSLVYSLLTWIMLCIVLPACWEKIISPSIYNNEINRLNQIWVDKRDQAKRILQILPEEVDPVKVLFIRQSGEGGRFDHSISIWGYTESYEQMSRYLKYLNEVYYPASLDVENTADDLIRKRINIENTKNLFSFYNPIVLFKNISNKIAGNSRNDYLRFLQTGRGIRNDLINQGIRDGWLLDYRFYARYSDQNIPGSRVQFIENFRKFNSGPVRPELNRIAETLEKFTFEMPVIRRYEQPNPSFGEIFIRIVVVLSMFVLSILIMWILTWYKFMTFDVR